VPPAALSPGTDESSLSVNPEFSDYLGQPDESDQWRGGGRDNTPPVPPAEAKASSMPPPAMAPPPAPPQQQKPPGMMGPPPAPQGAPAPAQQDTQQADDIAQMQAIPPEPSVPPEAAPTDYSGKRQSILKDIEDRGLATPTEQKSNWAQRLGMALLASTKLAPVANMLVHPKWSEQERKRQAALTADEEQLKILNAAETGESLSEQRRSKAKELLAEEAKRPYITIPGGGLFNTETKTWERQPIDKSQLTPITKEQADASGIQPLADGTYAIPNAAVGSLISSNKDKSVKTIEERLVQVMGDDSLTPEQKQKAAGDLVHAHNMLHPTAPIHSVETDGGGNSTLVIADPTKPTSVQKIPLGKIGKPQQAQPGINLTPEAIAYWGQAAAAGIPLPSMGMGAAGAKAREQIINAAPTAAGGTPLAASRATQRADTTSLGAMTKMRDSVVAFENTAKANLDVFMQQAKKAVDSGSPWINTPLREVARQGLGSADLAAFDAARQVALTEIAKVVNNPSLSSVLSDSARKEVTSLIPENATLNQIYHVVSVLNQDMANRHRFLDEGIKGISQRLGGTGGGTPSSAAPKTADEYLRSIGVQK
jgi:hypothetical protein